MTKLNSVRTGALKAILLALSISSLSIIGCSSGSDDKGSDNGPSFGGDYTNFEFSGRGDSDGFTTTNFKVPNGTNKFMVNFDAAGDLLTISSLSSNGAEYAKTGGRPLTSSNSIEIFTGSINVPSRTLDAPINSANTFSITAGGSKLDNKDIKFYGLGRSDSDLSKGTLIVNIYIVSPSLNSVENQDIINRAIARFRAIYASANITLSINIHNLSSTESIQDMYSGTDFYLNNVANKPSPAVNLFISNQLTYSFENGESALILGLAGGIPGPWINSLKSGVAVSFSQHSGVDDEFSPAEELIFGETLAHEVGHYIGLFHPIEIDTDSEDLLANGADPLSDTEECGSYTTCSLTLYSNLMFPFPVRSGNGGFVEQVALTGQQSGVLNLSALVD